MQTDLKKKLDEFEAREKWYHKIIFIKIVVGILLTYALISGFLTFDKAQYTGEDIEGEIVRVGKSQTGYRSVTVINSATVRLDNGNVEYISGGNYRVGDLATFRVYKTRLTKRTVYQYVVIQ